MKWLIFLLPFFLSTSAMSAPKVSCKKHKIYCKIKSLKPSMSYKKAMRLSNLIYKHSRKRGDDPILAVAIAMQEMSLRNKTGRREAIIVFKKVCTAKGRCFETWKRVKGYSDICMFQFHASTIVYEGIDPIRLKNSLGYCVAQHFKLMRKKRKICKKIVKSWGCYHSGNKRQREKYIKEVERFL